MVTGCDAQRTVDVHAKRAAPEIAAVIELPKAPILSAATHSPLPEELKQALRKTRMPRERTGPTGSAAAELALDVAYESDETSEDPRLLPAIATEIEAYDDPKQISPGYSTSEGEDEACRLGCGDLSPYSTSEDEDHAAPLRGRGPLPSYRPSKLTRRSKALGARRRGKTVAFASEPLSVAILTPVSAVKPQRVAFSPVAPAEVLELSSVEVLPPRRWRRMVPKRRRIRAFKTSSLCVLPP